MFTRHQALSDKQPSKPRIQAGTWVFDRELGCLVPKYGRNYFPVNEKKSDLASPYVQAGGMPEIFSHADGKRYETKRNYYRAVSRAGAEIIGFDRRWREHIKDPQIYDGGDKAHEADIVRDVKKAIEIEESKLPPRGTAENKRIARRQKRERKGL